MASHHEAATLSESVRRAVVAHAAEDPRHEVCGLLIGTRSRRRIRVEEVVRCENRAPPDERTRRFEIDPLRVLREERARRSDEREVVGFYHSHTRGDPVPSPEDRTYMAYWPKTLWLILAPADGEGPVASPRLRGWTTPRYGKAEAIREVEISEG